MTVFIKNIFKKLIQIFKRNKYTQLDIPYMQHWRTTNNNYNLQEYIKNYKNTIQNRCE